MSERYEMSYSDNYLLMTLSSQDVTTQAERDALEKWKLAEVKRGTKNEQLMFLNQIIREFPPSLKASERFKKIQEQARTCAKDISTCDQAECKLRSGILKSLAQQVFRQVQFRFDLQNALIRKHDLNYAQSLELLYARELQTVAGKQKQKDAEHNPLICELDNKITVVIQEIEQTKNNLSKLKWCWSKEKRRQKESLVETLGDLNDYLNRLKTQRRIWTVI